MPKIPSDFSSLARLANDNQVWRDADLLWEFAVDRDANLAAKAARHPAGKPWPKDIVKSFTEVRMVFTERNRRKHSAKTKHTAHTPPRAVSGVRRAAPRQAAQRQQLHEMEIVGHNGLFFMETDGDSHPAHAGYR